MSIMTSIASRDAESPAVSLTDLRPILSKLTEEAVERAVGRDDAEDLSDVVHEQPAKVVQPDELWADERLSQFVALEMASRWSIMTGYSAAPRIQAYGDSFTIGGFSVPQALLLLLADHVVSDLAEPEGINIAPLQATWAPAIQSVQNDARDLANEVAAIGADQSEAMRWGVTPLPAVEPVREIDPEFGASI